MLNELFSSGSRVKVLKLFLFNSKNKYYQREIALRTNLPIRAVQREVVKLEKIGILEKSASGNRFYYALRPDCPVITDLKSLFIKTAGIGDVIKEHFDKQKSGIKTAFVYGSYAGNKEGPASDIDIFAVGSISSKTLSMITSRIGHELGREINYVLYSESEYREKKRRKDHFVSSVLAGPKVFIIGGGR